MAGSVLNLEGVEVNLSALNSKWYARVDSNHWPFAPEANALSRLSYGRVKQQNSPPP